jgi:acyl carrier protein
LNQKTTDRGEIEAQITDVFVTEGMVERSAITPEATLESLGVQSVDVMMVLMSIEEKFGVYIPIDGKLTESKNLKEFINHLIDRIVDERKSSAS